MNYSVRFQPERRTKTVDGVTTLIEKNVPLRLSIIFNSKRIYYYTGKRCDISQWDNKNQGLQNRTTAPNGQSRSDFNDDLLNIKKGVSELFKFYTEKKIIPTPDQIRSDLKKNINCPDAEFQEPKSPSFFKCFDHYIKEISVAEATKNAVWTHYNHLMKYCPELTFNSIDHDFLNEFKKHLIKELKLSKNSVSAEFNRMNRFLKFSVQNGWIIENPFNGYKIDTAVYGKPIYITIAERDKLFKAQIDDEEMALIRDLFVFQCFIGCRYGDLVHLKRSNIINGCVEYIARKTRDFKPVTVSIPLTEKAKAIIARYNCPDGKLFPRILLPLYDQKIKVILRNLEINRIVTKLDPKTRENIQVPICDVVSSHMARRCFIGNLYKLGIPLPTIATMSGHVKDSKAMTVYFEPDQEQRIAAIKMME